MRVLIDTHVWLWMQNDPDRIAKSTRDVIVSAETERYISVTSVWELGIKYHAGKLALHAPPSSVVATWLARHGAKALAIELAHVLRAAELPPHHGDPFDRMLIAQAQIEGLTLVSADPHFDRYDVKVLRAD